MHASRAKNDGESSTTLLTTTEEGSEMSVDQNFQCCTIATIPRLRSRRAGGPGGRRVWQ